MPTAVKYKIDIKTYRDASHPSGYGFVANTLYLETAELSFTPDLPVLPDLYHYQMILKGFNAANEMLGRYEYSFGGSGDTGTVSVPDYRVQDMPELRAGGPEPGLRGEFAGLCDSGGGVADEYEVKLPSAKIEYCNNKG